MRPDASPTASAAGPDPVALFDRLTAVFGGSYRPERLVAHSEERALIVAWDVILKRRVALRAHLRPNTPGREWFLRESELLARLDHPGVRRVYAAGFADELAYRVTSWIEGESLADAVARGPRPIPEVMQLARDLLAALEHAHGRGVIIRRVVPATVLVTTAGRYTLTDLRHSNSCLGLVVGADDPGDAPFLAPEVRGGRPGDPSADVYAAGALLYYAAVGHPPAADPHQIIPPTRLRDVVPQAVERVILRALAPTLRERFLTADEMLAEFQQYAGAWERPAADPGSSQGQAGRGDDHTDWENRLRRALGDDYELLTELGTGSFGRVYRVRDLRLEREVALKVLHPSLTVDPTVVERFTREAQLAARVQHPNIVDIYDIDGRGGLLWYTMELIRGPSLGTIVSRDGPLPLERVLGILRDALWALEHAHAAGLVHRDLKPENLLVDPSGRILLSDFGLALALRGDGRFGGASSRSGTPQFAAPEQLLGEHVDPRTDLYSLAIVAYYTLLGSPPFEAPSPEAMIARQLAGKLPSLARARRDVRPELDAVLRRAASARPEDRFASAADFRKALERAGRRGLRRLVGRAVGR